MGEGQAWSAGLVVGFDGGGPGGLDGEPRDSVGVIDGCADAG